MLRSYCPVLHKKRRWTVLHFCYFYQFKSVTTDVLFNVWLLHFDALIKLICIAFGPEDFILRAFSSGVKNIITVLSALTVFSVSIQEHIVLSIISYPLGKNRILKKDSLLYFKLTSASNFFY